MINTNNFKSSRFAGKAGLAALVVSGAMTLGSASSYAVVRCGSAGLPATVPLTVDGTYINLATQVVNNAGTIPGWDFNVYSNAGATGSTLFFTSVAAANTNALMGDGTANGSPALLAAGATIGPAATFFTGGSASNVATSPWRTTQTGGYIGVRFVRESTTTTHYGWVRMNTTAATGFPATITAFCYQDVANTAITAGTVPVSLQKFSVD